MAPLTIIIDTREQTPWAFPAWWANTRRGTLNAGDYALEGDPAFAIERKSLDDFAGTLSSGWDRFQNELERMQAAQFVARVVIVEGSLADVLAHNYSHPNVLPPFLLKRVATLTLWGVTVLFAGDPLAATGLAFTIFYARAKELALLGETDHGKS